MSIIASKISVDKSVIVGRIDSPLDARTRCNNTADFPNIETPFIGMIIFTTDDMQYWVVTELQSKLIGSQMIENYQIKSYEKLVDILGAAASGGAEYTAGGGISISDKNVISVDFNTVAKKSDIVKYTAGAGISIQNGVITCTVAGGATEYSAGEGLLLVGTKFEVDYSKVAKKSDIKSYSGSDNISISSDGKIDITDKVALKSDLKAGEVVADYNKLDNKPLFAAGAGIEVGIVRGGSLEVSGAGNTDSNGTYELADYNAIGTARVWQKANRKIYHDGTKWLIDSDTDGASFYYSATGDADPWTLTFAASLSDFGVAPTVALVDNGMSDKVQYVIKGVPNSLQDGDIGLYTDAKGLHFGGINLLVRHSEILEIIDNALSQQLGDINSILDEINGEVI